MERTVEGVPGHDQGTGVDVRIFSEDANQAAYALQVSDTRALRFERVPRPATLAE